MLERVEQGLIWRAARPACVLIALEPHPPSVDETAFLDWLATRGVERVVAGEHEVRGPSGGSSAAWTSRSDSDLGRAELAAGVEDFVGSLRAATPDSLRADVATYLKSRGWSRRALLAGHRPLFGFPSAPPGSSATKTGSHCASRRRSSARTTPGPPTKGSRPAWLSRTSSTLRSSMRSTRRSAGWARARAT
jgi:hypothetical protein